MKKFIGLFVLLAITFATHAQSYQAKIGDTTITNAGAPSYTVTVAGPKSNVTFGYNITKTSGTVAGTIVLSGSVDGTNYATLKVDTLADASANLSVSYPYNGYAKYKVTINQTGTDVANYKIWLLHRH